jgi:hypothetical protein
VRFGDVKVVPYISIEGPTDNAPRTAKAEPITKPSRVVNQTDADRLVSAKAQCIARSKANSADPNYGSHTHQSYWQDFAGSETSAYRFDHLMFLLGFLKDPKWEHLSHNYRDGDYNRRTGIWTRGDQQISIRDLKDALAKRIAELGISEVLLFEYLAIPHSWTEDRVFYALSFDERMRKFLAVA